MLTAATHLEMHKKVRWNDGWVEGCNIKKLCDRTNITKCSLWSLDGGFMGICCKFFQLWYAS